MAGITNVYRCCPTPILFGAPGFDVYGMPSWGTNCYLRIMALLGVVTFIASFPFGVDIIVTIINIIIITIIIITIIITTVVVVC